jgi:long-chain acyl-CoA synthetase
MNDFTRLFDIIYYQQEKYSKTDCFNYKYNGVWRHYSTKESIEIANKVSKSLLKLGLQPDDKVALISPNRPEWNFLDLGMLQVGVVNVPIYPTISEADYKFIFNDAGIKYVFVADLDLFTKINNIKGDCPALIDVFTIDEVTGGKGFETFLNIGKEVEDIMVENAKNVVQPDQLATIIYTSGTTGTPKGVMLSHNNVVSNVKSLMTIFPITAADKTLSFLPLCHIFERVAIYVYMAVGCSTYYGESLEKLVDNLKEVKPNFFTCVPRLLEKVYERIIAKGLELTGIKKKLFFWAVDFALQYDGEPRTGIKFAIYDRLIYSKWREALGGNVTGIVTGAAALQERLGRVFSGAGIPIREGYGQTETSPAVSVNRFEPNGFKFGTIGPLIPGVEVKIGANNELLVKGPNVMMGYYKRPDLTAEVIDNDGWLHTGDCGEFIEGKFLKITDRVKELFKTSGGKYVAPQVIENKMKESRFIEQICVVGENEKFVGALIVPSFLNMTEWATKNGLVLKNHKEMVESTDINKLMKNEIDKLNENFGHVEKIKKFKLLTDEWSIASGELTPTMKIKRKVVMKQYQKEIEEMYREDLEL